MPVSFFSCSILQVGSNILETGHIHSLDDAGTYLLNGPLKSYKDHGFGLCLVQLREDGIPIGIAGLLKRDYLDMP
jgi:hypothetical protein